MYVVIENTPGYMPESEPAEFEEYEQAVAYANELADGLEEQGWTTDRSWASRDNFYAIHAELASEATTVYERLIEVARAED